MEAARNGTSTVPVPVLLRGGWAVCAAHGLIGRRRFFVLFFVVF